MGLSVADRVLAALFLCSDKPGEILAALKPAWNEIAQSSSREKLEILGTANAAENVFPWKDELSSGIDFHAFCSSHFVQPDLFLRIRPGYNSTVKKKLDFNGLAFEELSNSSWAFPNSSKLDSIIDLDREAVIQDYSSQQVGTMLDIVKQQWPAHSTNPPRVWDCCAASGGKSIMATDILGAIELSVSDIRESILVNLQKRFVKAGIKNHHRLVADLSGDKKVFPASYFDLIIADVPCTGSGTWGRTPEQLFYFENERIEAYASLQKKIVVNAVSALQIGGYFLYITCSVFRKENEEVVDLLQQQNGLHLINKEIFQGYHKKADTMFAALLQKIT